MLNLGFISFCNKRTARGTGLFAFKRSEKELVGVGERELYFTDTHCK